MPGVTTRLRSQNKLRTNILPLFSTTSALCPIADSCARYTVVMQTADGWRSELALCTGCSTGGVFKIGPLRARPTAYAAERKSKLHHDQCPKNYQNSNPKNATRIKTSKITTPIPAHTSRAYLMPLRSDFPRSPLRSSSGKQKCMN